METFKEQRDQLLRAVNAVLANSTQLTVRDEDEESRVVEVRVEEFEELRSVVREVVEPQG